MPSRAALSALFANPAPVLCVDIGNTRAKATLFAGGEVVDTTVAFTQEKAREWAARYRPVGAILSSTGPKLETYLAALAAAGVPCLQAGVALRLPFENLYKSPTLGPDRIAAVAGALLHIEPPFVVIDAGTCLTYEVVDAQGRYLGGAISPGIDLRLEAMHRIGPRLPRYGLAPDAPLVGQTTQTCMQGGALQGAAFEVEGYRAALAAAHPGLQTVLTGGGSRMLAQRLVGPIFAVPNLVPEGLLLLYHYQQAAAGQ